MPWTLLSAPLQSHYPKGKGGGRRPIPQEIMLRIYFLRQFFGLSDPVVEDALYDNDTMLFGFGAGLGTGSDGDLQVLALAGTAWVNQTIARFGGIGVPLCTLFACTGIRKRALQVLWPLP